MTFIFGDGKHPGGVSGAIVWLFFEVCDAAHMNESIS